MRNVPCSFMEYTCHAASFEGEYRDHDRFRSVQYCFRLFRIRHFGSIGAAYAITAIYIISGLMGMGYVICYLHKLPKELAVTNNEESDIINKKRRIEDTAKIFTAVGLRLQFMKAAIAS